MLQLSIALLVTASILFVARSAARVRALQIERAQSLRDEFFASARTLVEDSRTPELLVEVTEFLAATIGDKHLTRTFWRLLTGRLGRRYDLAHRDLRPLEAIVPVPSDLLPVWRHLTRTFVLAITFNGFLIGALIRRLYLPATVRGRRRNDGFPGNGNAEVNNERARVVVQDLVDRRFHLSNDRLATA